MKCRSSLIFALIFATRSFASTPLVATPPSPCPQPKRSVQTIDFHQSSAEILAPLKRPDPITPLGCDRPFAYQGEIYSVDAPQSQDASNLKYFTRSVPAAALLLEDYQTVREATRITAYICTVAVVVAVLAPQIARRIERSPPWHAEHLAQVIRLSALAFAAGNVAYSFSVLRENEKLLSQAVNTYNQSSPKDPIELRFNTTWSF
ncbi:MAG: hypothetical protein H7333_01075 [Bdellovibrionales bacterium]|nr:hypothetical protein [Oligoflexia bacterium]